MWHSAAEDKCMKERKDNVIYIRSTKLPGPMKFEAFVKAEGEGSVVAGETREEAIIAASQILWAIERYGHGWKAMAPLDTIPLMPKEFNYPVIDEQ